MDKHPFHFLSQIYSYPEKDTVESSAQALCLLAADLEMADVKRKEVSAISHTELQSEYVRLFINAYGGVWAPPYASIYIGDSGMLRQKGYEEALSFYQKAGLIPAASDESPDHIAHELAFVGLLLDKESDDLLYHFLDKHLLVWYPKFLQRLMDAAPSPFYSVLGQVSYLCLKLIKKEVVHE